MAGNNTVGLYIGTETADLVSLTGSFQRPRLLNFGKVLLPVQSTWRNMVRAEESASSNATPAPAPTSPVATQTEEEVIRSVRSLLQKLGGPVNRVHTAIASEAAIVRYFQMPTIPPRERTMAVSFEAKKYLPFKLDELYTDFKTVIRRTDATLMKVMFFGVKKSSMATYLSLFHSIGVTPLSLEPAPLSLLRILRQNGQLISGQVVAMLLVEHDNATISIARDDLLYLSRNVSITPNPEGEAGTSPELLQALTNETRVSIDYYRRRFLGEPAVTKIIVFANQINPKQIAELTSGLDLPVEAADPFRRISGGKDVPVGLAVATGVALRALERKAGEINLLPKEFKADADGLFKPVTIAAGLALAALFIGYGVSRMDLGTWEQKIAQVRADHKPPPGVTLDAPIPQLQALQVDHYKNLQFLQNLTKMRGECAVFLRELSRTIPKEIWIRQVIFQNNFKSEPPGSISSLNRSQIFKMVGGSYLNDRDRELQGVNTFLDSIRSNERFKSTFSVFNLDGVQRNHFYEEDITEFRFTCGSSAQSLKESGP